MPDAADLQIPDAADLQIAGLVPLSTVDWPGKLAASIFLQGCPWRCVYCQNHEILDPRTPGSVPWSQVVELLQRRRGLLDGLVFSGGEATRQPGLLSAAQEVKALGFAVGLHTAGIYPGNLARLLAADAVDWVGLDIKALPGPDYQQVVARGGGGEKAWRALELVLNAGVDYEVRLTVYPGYPGGVEGAFRVASSLHDAGVASLALQVARSLGAPEGFVADGDNWAVQVEQLEARIGQLGFASFLRR